MVPREGEAGFAVKGRGERHAQGRRQTTEMRKEEERQTLRDGEGRTGRKEREPGRASSSSM